MVKEEGKLCTGRIQDDFSSRVNALVLFKRKVKR
jgi:hypothetical protein